MQKWGSQVGPDLEDHPQALTNSYRSPATAEVDPEAMYPEEVRRADHWH